ncbi:DUF1549 and DUF1553 domain-containing protein [uncultured Nevskia sp.]|uniref:DUF1549 and DUF1553 domain-containing protein n=1 Tax=uncultured Nevskia sp. TaxID=228950 RepID=UPI0025CE8536|nr:DUF1549 and DUF1553 domain-containing protein [uncultured Nevskia sp.]
MNRKQSTQAFVVGLLVAALSATAAEQPDAATATRSAVPAARSTALWSYQPVATAPVPKVKAARWVRTPIDAFVLAKLEAQGLKPSQDTDRASFIRRATLDVWGVIPTPDEVHAFVSDRSPDAYEKLADRLLASPKYGERQTRRWLDLARYADSAGFQGDQTRPNMWRYRDWVIKAFNDDKPYDQFVQEQLAGDELKPGDQDALVATGFLRGYPDNINSRDLVQKKYQHTTDMVDTVGEVFLAQTVGCARCHNHKSDRISQKEYFQLQAFFANTSAVDDIAATKGPLEIAYEQADTKWKAATAEIRARRKAIIDQVREPAKHYLLDRYSQATQASLRKLYSTPEAQWTAHDRWVINRFSDYGTDEVLSAFLRDNADPSAEQYKPEYAGLADEYRKLGDDLKKFDKLKPEGGSLKISAMSELGQTEAPPTHLLFGGDFERPLEEVQPGFPAAITSEKPVIVPTATSSGRRTALARWIASPQNPLTARVFVNRVWDQYFGRGIVETLSDFGKAGQKPTHPELLDHLASSFIEHGWSVKQLHREILLSSVYRQSSAFRQDVASADPDNKLLAVFPRRRLDAETIRDSLLVASGELAEKVGGPSVFPPVPSNLFTGNAWTVSSNHDDWNRRSLYIFTRRSIPYPLLQPFDIANTQQAHAKRDITTTPLQALTLFNSDIVFDWSKALAGRVIRERGSSASAQLDGLYEIVYARKPDKQEKATLLAFLDSQEKVLKQQAANGTFAINVPTGLEKAGPLDPIRAAAFVDLTHAVVNSNEFTYRF